MRESGQGVLDVQRYGRVDGPLDDAGLLQSTQGLSQYLRAHALEASLQLTEASGTVFQRSDGEGGPLVRQQGRHGSARALGAVDLGVGLSARPADGRHVRRLSGNFPI